MRLADGDGGDDGKTLLVTVETPRVPAPTPLTCKGAEGLTYPAFRLASIEPR